MTGLIGGRWTAGNRLELSRPNGRGRRFFAIVPLQDFRDARKSVHQGGPRQEEASSLASAPDAVTRPIAVFAHTGRVDEPAGLGFALKSLGYGAETCAGAGGPETADEAGEGHPWPRARWTHPDPSRTRS